jgi:hypothetical protein
VRLRVCEIAAVEALVVRQEGFGGLGEAAVTCLVEKRASRAWWVGHNILILFMFWLIAI